MTGEEFLLKGQQAREAGRTFEALDFLNHALDVFILEKNYARFAHALLDRGICWQHLYQFHGNDPCFAVLYKKDAEAVLEILQSQKIEQELDGAYFMNAKAASLFGDFTQAVEFFTQAIQHLPDENQVQKGDWQTNLGRAIYYTGKHEAGITQILSGIEQMQAHADGVDDYTFRVWLSGAYLRLAEIYLLNDKQKSNEYLQTAKGILGDDSKFIVRQKQIENFIKTGKSGL